MLISSSNFTLVLLLTKGVSPSTAFDIQDNQQETKVGQIDRGCESLFKNQVNMFNSTKF